MRERFVIWALLGGLLALSLGDSWPLLAFAGGFWVLGAVCLPRLSSADLNEIIGAVALLLGLTVIASIALHANMRRGPAAALELVGGLARSVAGALRLARSEWKPVWISVPVRAGCEGLRSVSHSGAR